MITLITGVPGAGKTALLVSMLLDEFKARRAIVDGIPELTVPHEPAPPVVEWTHYVSDESSQDGRKLSFTFEPNSLVVIDEAQRIFRVRAAGAKVPDAVAAFETHRHLGLDFVLLCQHAGLIDPNIRKLVGRHIHIRATVLGRKLYEWSEVGDPESKTSRDISARRSFKLPKKVFSRYKSAEVHTKIKRRIPTYVVVLVVAVLVFAGLGYRFYSTVNEKMSGGKPNGSVLTSNNPHGAGAPVGAGVVARDYFAMGRERVEGLPHTAPQFDELTKPKSVPFPSACAASSSRCTCYTDQATRIETMPEALCRKVVAEGLYQAYAEMRANGMPGFQPGQPDAVRAVDVKAEGAKSTAGAMVASIESAPVPRSGSHIRAGGVTGASQGSGAVSAAPAPLGAAVGR